MMFGNGNGYGYDGGYNMMSGWGGAGGIVGVISLVLVWALMISAIAALWAWHKKNK